jgi:hypothetical protein
VFELPPDDMIERITEATGQRPQVYCRHFDSWWKIREHRDKALKMAKSFYEVFRDPLFPYLAGLTREELVELVSHYRNEKRETERIVVDMWLMNRFTPPHVVGVLRLGG